MMNDEEYLNKKFGKRNPFTVPEGYFDTLADNIIASLPQEKPEKKAIARKMRPLFYAAACGVVAILCATIYNFSTYNASQQQVAATSMQEQPAYSDSYFDEAADYAMLGNDEIYATLLADI